MKKFGLRRLGVLVLVIVFLVSVASVSSSEAGECLLLESETFSSAIDSADKASHMFNWWMKENYKKIKVFSVDTTSSQVSVERGNLTARYVITVFYWKIIK